MTENKKSRMYEVNGKRVRKNRKSPRAKRSEENTQAYLTGLCKMPKAKKKVTWKTKKPAIRNIPKWRKDVIAYVKDKIDRKNVKCLSIKLAGSRAGSKYSRAPKETSDVDVVVVFPRTKSERGSEKIKMIYKRLGIPIHKTHPWRYKGVKIDFIPETKEV